MGAERFTRTGGLIRTGPATTAVVVAAVLVAAAPAGGTAAAAARPDGATARHTRTAAADTISTVAGGVGGPARATNVGLLPLGLAFGAGQVYVTENGVIRAVNPRTDRLTTPVGTRARGPLGDGGPATQASLSSDTSGVAVDHSHNLVIADSGNNRIRVVAARTGTFYGQNMTAGNIYTVAGTGTPGGSGDGGSATSGELDGPQGVAVGSQGSLVIADSQNNEVRLVAARTGTFFGHRMTAGDIYTIAAPPQVGGSNFVPAGVAVDAAGNAVVSDYGQDHIWVVAAHTGTFYGQAMTAGDIYTIAGNGDRGYSGNGGPATSAKVYAPYGVALDRAGNVLIGVTGNRRVRVVAARTGTFYRQAMTAGDIYTIAGNGGQFYSGDGGPATGAELRYPSGVAVTPAGNVLIADSGNNRIRVAAASTGTFYGKAMTAGHIYTVAGTGLKGFSGDGGTATQAKLHDSSGIAVDAHGNLVITDLENQRIRVVAASNGTFYGQAMTAGNIYTIAGNGTAGFSGDGGPATSAELFEPSGATVDAAGNVLIADTQNNRVRVVAENNGTFYGQAMTAGDIYTIAGTGTRGFSGDGGPATGAELYAPTAVTVDAAGNLLIADFSNNRVRVVAASTGTFYGRTMTTGHIYTIAGNGTFGFSGDGGPATSAEVDGPESATVDAAGNVLIADSYNHRIRVVAASTGTFYGQTMTAGHIYTIAGNGGGGALGGFSGDGGPATGAELGDPSGVAVTAGGNVLIADPATGRVRMVTG